MHRNANGITNSASIVELEYFLNEQQIYLIFIKLRKLIYKIYRQDQVTHVGGALIGCKMSIP